MTTSMGLDTAGLVKSPQQLQAEQQQAAQASMQAMVQEQMINSMGAIAEEGAAASIEGSAQGTPQ